jgi:hypothetical protein
MVRDKQRVEAAERQARHADPLRVDRAREELRRALAVVSWSIRNDTSAGWFTTSCRYGPAGSRRNVVLVSGNVGDATT